MKDRVNLNDIPMDLFFKYFTKEDLADRELKPSLIKDNRIFFKYSIVFGANTYFFFSIYDKDSNLSVLKDEIKTMFSDLETTEPTSITLVTPTMTSAVQSYTLLSKPYLTNSKYYFEFDNDTVTDTVVKELVYIDGDLIKDYRTELSIFEDVTSVSLEVSAENPKVFLVYDDADDSFLGYLREYPEAMIQERNSNGQLLFINESGNKTTESLRGSRFLRHNNAIRKGFFGLENPEDIIPLKFNPGTIGIFVQGSEQKLLFYQNFL